MIREINIDLSATPPVVPIEIGKQGEDKATRLLLKLPEELVSEDITEYAVAFGSEYGIYHSNRISKSALVSGDSLLVDVSAEISANKNISLQIEAYNADSTLLAKSSVVKNLQFAESVCRVHTSLADSMSPADQVNIIAGLNNAVERIAAVETELSGINGLIGTGVIE